MRTTRNINEHCGQEVTLRHIILKITKIFGMGIQVLNKLQKTISYLEKAFKTLRR